MSSPQSSTGHPPEHEHPDGLHKPSISSLSAAKTLPVAHLPPLPSSKPGAKPRDALDIEHVPVEDDPRQWTPLRKNMSLALIASASMVAGLAGSIQNPAVKEMEVNLPATSSQFSWSISMFILIQGIFPLFWSAVSEIKGRKLAYLASLLLFTLGSIVVAVSPSIGLVIGFRCFQAAGSSAVISIGAATLADIFDPAERGKKMGIYYIAPLLGPALGPIFGGALTTGLGWRAIFWFLTVVSGSSFVSFLFFFRDTFRKERSLTYQNVLKKRLADGARHPPKPATTSNKAGSGETQNTDLEKHDSAVIPLDNSTISLSFMDVSPFRPLGIVLRRKNNFITLFASGLLFAYAFLIPYTSARTLSAYYYFDALKIGLVTLSYGFGSIAGSLLGGRWSDYQLARLKAENGGISKPEMRLQSTIIGVLFLPPFTVGFGWVCQKHVHVSAICIFLFMCGFLSIWIYSSTLAYIVDANNGRSSTAVAGNSAFRGVFAFVAIEMAVPLQDGVGDGWMYTIWAGIMALCGCSILLVLWKGGEWREKSEAAEMRTSS